MDYAVMYLVGVSGALGNGLIAWLSLNWIPLGKNHWQTYVIQVAVGLAFSFIWFLVFRFLIKKFNFLTPERRGYGNSYAAQILEFLGWAVNIVDVTNCATRLRVNVKDANLVRPEADFKRIGAHGLSVNGTAIQVIVGLKVLLRTLTRKQWWKFLVSKAAIKNCGKH